MNGQRIRILCNAILIFFGFALGAQAESWAFQYEANALNPDGEQPAAGWEAHNTAPRSVAMVDGGILHMETTVERNGLWFGMKQKTDAWAKTVYPGRDWSIEARVKVVSSAGADGGFTIWAGNGDRKTAYLVISPRGLKWGMKATGQTLLATNLDNASAFHTYRIDFDAKSETFSVYRDKKRIKRDLPNASSYPYRWLLFGDPASTCQMKAEVDYIRFKGERGPILRTVLAFGDTATAGVYPGSKGSYTDLLPNALKSAKTPAAIINSGKVGLHSGRKTQYAPGLQKTPQAIDLFENEVLNFAPDAVVMQFGMNDSWIDSAKANGTSRTKLEDFARNLDTMVLTLMASGTDVILMTPNPLGKQHPKFRDQRLAQYAQVIRNIAKREALPLVDVRRLFQTSAGKRGVDTLLADGMHPNANGQKLIANAVATELRGLYRPKPFMKIDLANRIPTSTVISRNGARLVQVNTAALPGDRIVAVFQKRTNTGNQIMLARSDDGGAAWKELPSPREFDLDANSPTLHAAGNTLFLLVSYPRMAISHSKNAGDTWSPLYPLFPPSNVGTPGDSGVLPPASLLTNGSKLIMIWHDATSYEPRINFGLFQSTSTDAGRSWSMPDQVSIHPKHLGARPADPVLIPNPQTGSLICIAKDASRTHPTLHMVSSNGGENWSDLRAVNSVLTGDRHAAIRAKDGRLVIVFRDRARGSKWNGDTVAWVGTDDDLIQGRQGQYLVRLLENPAAGGTADIERRSDGMFLVTSAYAFKTAGAVRCTTFNLKQLDSLARGKMKK